jgi:hypothetical protein
MLGDILHCSAGDVNLTGFQARRTFLRPPICIVFVCNLVQTSRLVVLPFNARERHSAVNADESAMVTTGIIVIAVVVCVVGTSLVWVLVIYKTRRKSMFKLAGTTFDTSSRNADGLIGSEADGSAQRLLQNYSSLPGHHHSLSRTFNLIFFQKLSSF